MKKIKCPWCSKLVEIYKGRLRSHVTSNNRKCVGIGQPAEKVAALNRLREQNDKS